MSSRYIDSKLISYCVSPRVVWQSGERYVVPCGKCDGCLLHKSNNWSMRLKNEMDGSLVSLWFTLTYNNYYLPVLQYDAINHCYISDHDCNFRHDSKKVVRRLDDISIPSLLPFKRFRPENYHRDGDFIGYSSKRDFQLFLKNVRKLLYEIFNEYIRVRYYAISEYGPTTYRPHIHGLLFFDSFEAASYCKESALYQAWQMCDKTLFDEYTRLADSGVSGYLTNYITGFSQLPEFFKDRQIKPFRLSSKGASIGSDSFNQEEFFEKVITGDLQFVKRVERLDAVAVCQYPKSFTDSVFPKCYKYSKLPFARLLELYGFLFTNVRERKLPYHSVHKRLSHFRNASNSVASLRCFQICEKFSFHPFHYVFLLDMFYYRRAMSTLSFFYKSQIGKDITDVWILYDNFVELCRNYLADRDEYKALTLSFFLESYGYRLSDMSYSFLNDILSHAEKNKELYIRELEEVKRDSIKLPKANEILGRSPHIV